MGEYAKYAGKEIKIGTCESMYYLRFSQRNMVEPMHGSVNPRGNDALGIRFRFPWPDEDHIQPGCFDNFNRSLAIDGAPMPDFVEHNKVQFSSNSPKGYLVSLPCPESDDNSHGLTVHRNGFSGSVKLVEQKLLADGRVVPVLCCGGCEAAWRLEEPADIEQLAELARAMGEKQCSIGGKGFWDKVADRIMAGTESLATV